MSIIIEVSPSIGSHIQGAVDEAYELAKKLSIEVKFGFNGVDVYVSNKSNTRNAFERYKEVINYGHNWLVL